MSRVLTAPTRPVLRWHGGKFNLRGWILEHFPPHTVFTECFGGAGSLLFSKPRSKVEVYNDLDDEVVRFFRVLRDRGQCEQLIKLLKLTPFSRREFEASYEPSDDPVESARRLAIRSFMGFGSSSHASSRNGRGMIGFRAGTGFRANSNRSGGPPARDWANYPGSLRFAVERLAGVLVEGREAIDVILQHDSPETLHYLDPPYLPETRVALTHPYAKNGMYKHELDRDGHIRLLETIRGIEGMSVLSGYPSELYDDALHDWRRETTEAHADGARPRTEVLWLNPRCAERLDAMHGGVGTPLFSENREFERGREPVDDGS